MTVAAAITRLKTLTFTDLTSSFESVNIPPSAPQLPALIIEDVSQPFVDSLKAWNVTATKTGVVMFIDHILAIEYASNGTHIERKANITTFLDRYLIAISADMMLNNELAVPLQIIVLRRGSVFVRNTEYSGLRFRHRWELRI